MSTLTTLDAGEAFAGCTITRHIARSQHADVYKARKDDSSVALKIYRGEAARFMRTRIQREHAMLSIVEHANVSVLVGGGEVEGKPYLISEWVEGETLEFALSRGPLDLGRFLQVIADIGAGLGAIHRNKIIHRDIKPSNIMLGRDGAVILDFGHAFPQDEARITDGSQALGSVSYMSPEQASGSLVDERSDIYSLGVVMYEGLAGVRPFVSETAAEVLGMHLNKVPLPLRNQQRHVPPAVEDLCMWMLAKSPAGRLPNTRVLKLTIEAIAAQNIGHPEGQVA